MRKIRGKIVEARIAPRTIWLHDRKHKTHWLLEYPETMTEEIRKNWGKIVTVEITDKNVITNKTLTEGKWD